MLGEAIAQAFLRRNLQNFVSKLCFARNLQLTFSALVFSASTSAPSFNTHIFLLNTGIFGIIQKENSNREVFVHRCFDLFIACYSLSQISRKSLSVCFENEILVSQLHCNLNEVPSCRAETLYIKLQIYSFVVDQCAFGSICGFK